ncbi:hypothetical protein ACQ9ZG_11580 [Streptomyces araujoniae]|uniref:hypothetical protein n=1 Tax=Streptomyces sp. ZEA17I TaxID=2202516 RepID=UPI00215A8D77|nr:hypothetical protein [Streptomyces sp. ZEA17I]
MAAAKRSPKNPLDVDPGAIFAFRTSPLHPDSPPGTGRFGALAVVGRAPEVIVVAVFDGVWDRLPTSAEVREHRVLRRRRFAHTGRPAVFACGVEDTTGLSDLTALGTAPLTAEQTKLAAPYLSPRSVGTSFSTLALADADVEGEWRWAHDREALLREQEAVEERRRLAAEAEKERYAARLAALTWEQLLAETPFERWTPSPPFPPAAFRRAAARRVHQACRELRDLGPKPRKPAVRKVLKSLVLWFNTADQAAGWVIETEERECICFVLEELAHVAGHPSLVMEVDDWREW